MTKQIILPPAPAPRYPGHLQGPSLLGPGAGPPCSVTAHGTLFAIADVIMMSFPAVEALVSRKGGFFLIHM